MTYLPLAVRNVPTSSNRQSDLRFGIVSVVENAVHRHLCKTAILRSRRTALVLFFGASAASAMMQQPTAQAFLGSIYRPYLARDFKGQSEVPTLNVDPFLDAPDWEITKLSISMTADSAKATSRVAFDNFEEPIRLVFELVQTPASWRISDIKAPSGSLRALYKLR